MQKHFCINQGEVYNITNPNSIYIARKIHFKGYKQLTLHCYVDTGASLCLASKYVIPEELWENAPREINVTIANESTVTITKVCRNLTVFLAGEPFLIPTVYQQESGIDLLLGNNFCQLYGPFTEWIDRIALHLKEEIVLIKKITKALRLGKSPDAKVRPKKP